MFRDAEGGTTVACPWTPCEAGEAVRAPTERPVGSALTRRVVCVMQDAPLSAAREALDDAPGSLGIPVVDRHHRLVGRLAHAAAALALLGPPLAGAVSHHARPATGTVHEATPLGEAFRIMASRHARELLVVNSDHEIVGVLRDIDALQALVEARRSSSRPPTA